MLKSFFVISLLLTTTRALNHIYFAENVDVNSKDVREAAMEGMKHLFNHFQTPYAVTVREIVQAMVDDRINKSLGGYAYYITVKIAPTKCKKSEIKPQELPCCGLRKSATAAAADPECSFVFLSRTFSGGPGRMVELGYCPSFQFGLETSVPDDSVSH